MTFLCPAQFTQFLNFGHTVVRAQRGDQFVGSPRVRRYEMVGRQRTQAAVSGLVWGAMPTHGRTGLVIPVPAADALLASVGARYPGTVRAGLPAPVSLLYPFVVAAELDERVTTALHELFVEQVPIPVDFVECYRRGGFVALRPEPSDRLRELIARTWRRWPDVVPYEGVYGDVEPHVTNRHALFGTDGCADRAGGGRRAADLR
ncbi:MAG: hypothetical protein DLM61_19005 [Pseudonocardiales bacterium]|nr:MAG: hypothetical protein DLM61_19005 [Pseudonocardiales bacterium]